MSSRRSLCGLWISKGLLMVVGQLALTGMRQEGQAWEREVKKGEDHLRRRHREAVLCLNLAGSLPLPSPFYQIPI